MVVTVQELVEDSFDPVDSIIDLWKPSLLKIIEFTMR